MVTMMLVVVGGPCGMGLSRPPLEERGRLQMHPARGRGRKQTPHEPWHSMESHEGWGGG